VYVRISSSIYRRGASAGSFFTIPPQTQVEIASRKKIIIDEHSGRILVDSVLAEEEKKKKWKIYFLNFNIFKSRYTSGLFIYEKIFTSSLNLLVCM
jgi:hypothetical protein